MLRLILIGRRTLAAALAAAGLAIVGCTSTFARIEPSRAVGADEPQLNLLIVGDWGTGDDDQRDVARAMADYAQRLGPDTFAAILSTGDNFYGRLRGVDDPRWRTRFEDAYDPEALPMPFFAVLGNHDYENGKAPIELEYARRHPESRWKMPARWYRLDLPAGDPLATILMLDTNRDELGEAAWAEQGRWLREQLAAPRRAPWLITVGHHPLHSAGIHGGERALQREWGPLFEEHGVHLAIAGHDHSLQHIERPGRRTSFIVSGGGGRTIWGVHDRSLGPFVAMTHGFVHLRLGRDWADVVFVDRHARPIYAFSRRRERRRPGRRSPARRALQPGRGRTPRPPERPFTGRRPLRRGGGPPAGRAGATRPRSRRSARAGPPSG